MGYDSRQYQQSFPIYPRGPMMPSMPRYKYEYHEQYSGNINAKILDIVNKGNSPFLISSASDEEHHALTHYQANDDDDDEDDEEDDIDLDDIGGHITSSQIFK